MGPRKIKQELQITNIKKVVKLGICAKKSPKQANEVNSKENLMQININNRNVGVFG